MSTDHPLPALHHKRAKSVLSFMKRTPSAGTTLSSPIHFAAEPDYTSFSFLPKDHPHARPLGELQQNRQSQPPIATSKSKESRPFKDEGGKSLHKKTMSTISLKSLAGRGDAEKTPKPKESRPDKPKKSKSSANLASLLSRPKSSKNLRKLAQEEELRAQKDKENQAPSSSLIEATRPPPIYAQFSSEHFTKQQSGGKFLEEEIDRYTPKNYSPSKQRSFYAEEGQHPSLTRREDGSQRPKSTYLPSNFSLQDLSRRVSLSSRRASGDSTHSHELARKISEARRPSAQRQMTSSSTQSELRAPSRGQRVMTAVSSFTTKQRGPELVKLPDTANNSQSKKRQESAKTTEKEQTIADEDVEKEFEAMLDRRNIPENQRGKMRNLAMSMKKDFIRQDWAEIAASKNGRPGTNGSVSSAEAPSIVQEIPDPKAKRPRSRTFTLSRAMSKENLSPTKKSRGTTFGRRSRANSTESIKDTGKSLTPSGAAAAAAQTLVQKVRGQTPHDFVSYLKRVQKPELVEVGRLHKLRLLLRNETVAWTDEFIGQDGMAEMVGLLHRIMEVEWREEHEDTLLHEVLLCLKALCTTALALQHLNDFQTTLFPALIHMIFDEEKKGPSEFTTRNIVTWLLFTYLKSAPLTERPQRARTLLSYLRDPQKSEDERPVGFVLEMRRDRPYRVWCKEVVNVTKEVFWIFLHNMNVIALPGARQASGNDSYQPNFGPNIVNTAITTPGFDITNLHHVYMIKNFPQELPPVPAAPYVGGVEWDATNYLASHLDLINGILACLESEEERNILREQFIVSGWEKCMGSTLRLCKEKFYGGVHAGLRCWVAAAVEDGWDTHDVRCGPRLESRSPVRRTANKTFVEEAPKIEMKLDFLGGADAKKVSNNDDGWL